MISRAGRTVKSLEYSFYDLNKNAIFMVQDMQVLQLKGYSPVEFTPG
ncbi:MULTISPECIES: hypothetical protein [Robiginitalea]|uniref:Uncharacterized protein n=1 Tax=Robiginitalea biformata (strain ATCC BAA-864 / DSM 15991 / KCTC 12146 / HTCC2501) TaxID=313596 RepID=A4CN01_ROBBH|nr:MULTISPECIES: hypothetical protein [Robiginitalea]EAR15043.1 hypothetical protein RB2501_11972 [Robiginitalea biformata HTCC2501]MDC6355141.1 hypothetical protein [Robiginitalea sp. PM2]MDC6375644.1 hypothetical protein [Robiginitalea sp. SP8]